jgi:tripartite-type tricarboxylate transporter receptor subunit TctC
MPYHTSLVLQPNNVRRVRVISRIIACAALLFAGGVGAQTYPSKPVRILIGFTAGSSIDVVARILTQKLSESWKQAVIIDNRVGAGGNVAADAVAKVAPDGYTLLNSNIALAKARPGQLSFASGGVGNSDHMAGELFKWMAGINIVHVPYKGGNVALNDTITGEVAMYFPGVPVALPMIKAAKVKALGVTSRKRLAALPDVPTIAEAGLPRYEDILWYGFFGPAGMSKEIAAKIASDLGRVLKLPDVQERFAALGVDPVGSAPDDFTMFVKSEIDKWEKVRKATGLTID